MGELGSRGGFGEGRSARIGERTVCDRRLGKLLLPLSSCFPLFSKHFRTLSPGSCFFCHCGVVFDLESPFPFPSQPPDCHLDRESPRTTSAHDAAAVKGQSQSQLFLSAGTCVRFRYHRDRASYRLFWPSPAGPVRTQLSLGVDTNTGDGINIVLFGGFAVGFAISHSSLFALDPAIVLRGVGLHWTRWSLSGELFTARWVARSLLSDGWGK